MGAFEGCGEARATVYESTDPALVVTPPNAVGTATVSPYGHTPAGEVELYYQVDDGGGSPGVIWLVKGGPGLWIYF